MNETHPVPKEIDALLSEFKSLELLRDIYVRLPFGYRKAARAAKESQIKKNEFWQKLYAMYPELHDDQWEYRPYEMVIARKGGNL